ncbi:hypothetical protein IAU60_003733 [Kwoniella sp. DSM 27419]
MSSATLCDMPSGASSPTVATSRRGLSPDRKVLPAGCTYGPTLGMIGRKVVSQPTEETDQVPVIWVDFPPNSQENPFSFTRRRKIVIMCVALFFANITAYQTSAYSAGFDSMKRDLGMTNLQASAGVSLYGWGFALGPLALAPLTEEFGRYWMYIGSIGTYMLCHLTQSFRGFPMSLFTLSVVVGPGLGGATMCWTEANPHLEWRWIGWIQMMFLVMEPVVTFFALWAALVWGVFFIQIAGLPVVFKSIHGFGVTAAGSTYWAIVIGSVIGWLCNFYQDALYRKNVKRVGVEARLYAPMVAGIVFAVGCIIFGLTSIPSVHWIAPCIGIVIVLAAAFTIYQTCFV